MEYEEQLKALEGLNQSYMDMEDAQNAVAPRCHFRPMSLEQDDSEVFIDKWWECSICGHTKRISK